VAPVVRGLPLENGYVVRTDPTGLAEALFRDGRHVKLAHATALQIAALRADRLRLLQGKVWVRVPPRTGLTIEGLAANCHVTGTELQLEIAADGATTVTVLEGEVRFENPHGQVVVREAQQSRARPGEAPTQPVVAANLPLLLEWTNEVQPVVLLLETVFVSQDPERLQAALREAEALPEGEERWRRLGDVRHDRGELTEALEAYRLALVGLEGRPQGAPLLARVGQTWLELGKLPEADAAFRESLELDPNGTQAQVGQVMTRLSQDQAEAALAAAREAVRRAESAPVAHTALGLVLIRQGQREAAMQALERALALDARYGPALARRSFLLRAAERLEEA
jgi:tetratricopeptide (TPR) repeat protein